MRKIPEQILENLIKYLASKPYCEVAQILLLLSKLERIEEKKEEPVKKGA